MSTNHRFHMQTYIHANTHSFRYIPNCFHSIWTFSLKLLQIMFDICANYVSIYYKLNTSVKCSVKGPCFSILTYSSTYLRIFYFHYLPNIFLKLLDISLSHFFHTASSFGFSILCFSILIRVVLTGWNHGAISEKKSLDDNREHKHVWTMRPSRYYKMFDSFETQNRYIS